MRLVNILTLTGLSILIAFLVFPAKAQVVPDPVSLFASPQSPSPNQIFRVEAATPTFDAQTASFFWTVDGRSRSDLSGTGKNSITLKAGDLGSVSRIEVAVAGPQDKGGEAALSVRPSDLALTWSAEVYVPSWYRGKALPVANSIVDIVAVPFMTVGGSRIRSEDMIYTWTLDDDEAPSGRGRQILRIKVSNVPGSSHHVRVAVEDPDKRIRREGEVFIVPTNPRVVLYTSSPLGGPEIRSAPSFFSTLSRGILDFYAEPFFFSVASKRSLAYGWNVNGLDTQGFPDKRHLLSLNTEGQPASVLPITLTIPSADPTVGYISKLLTLLLQ